MEKKCNACNQILAYELFFTDKEHGTGRYTICKACKGTRTRLWRENNRSHYNESMRLYRAKNKDYFKNRSLKKSYGISLEDYEAIRVTQNAACAICRRTPDKRLKRPLAVDHCHKTKKVRGLLCYGCNRALHTLDNKKLLLNAIAYITKNE